MILINMTYKNPIVIGAGMIGSSVVYHLSKLGYLVKWIDSMPQGWFSTSKAAGLILHGSKKKVPKHTMAQETIRNIKTLQCFKLNINKLKYIIQEHNSQLNHNSKLHI